MYYGPNFMPGPSSSSLSPFQLEIYDIKPSLGACKSEEESRLELKQFNEYVSKQEQMMRVSIYLLLNISEDTKVEEKMVKRKIVFVLVRQSLLSHKSRHRNREFWRLSIE